jgi:hypothetical protein
MKVIKHTKFIWQYLDIFEDNICEHIANECMTHLHNDSLVSPREQTFSIKNDSYNLTFVAKKHPNLLSRKKLWDVDQLIHKIYCEVQNHYTENNALFRYTMSAAQITGFNSEYHFRHYSLNEEYKWHCDFHSNKNFVLSGITYLNDDFEGGGTRFLMDKLTVQPIKNSLLMFPSGPYFIHKSVPIRNGEKTIIWACFDRVCQTN